MGNSPRLFHFLAVLLIRSLLGSPYKALRCWQLLRALQQTPRATSEVPRAMHQVPAIPYKWHRSAPWEDKGQIPAPSQPLAPGTLLSVSWAGPASGEADRQTDRQLPELCPVAINFT